MAQKIDAIIIKRLDRETITIELETIEDKLEVFYKIINCRTIDIVGRYFNNKHFSIVCDDEGLLKANENNELPTSWFQCDDYTPNHEGLFGTLILTHCDNEGNLTSVDPMEIFDIKAVSHLIPTKTGEKIALLFHEVNERNN